MNTTKGCETLLATGKLSRLEKRFGSLQKKQEDALARMRQEKNDLKKQIESERLSYITRSIKQTGFPMDQPAILIGAILAAKEKLDSPECADEIDRYIQLYTEFADKHACVDEEEIEEEIDH